MLPPAALGTMAPSQLVWELVKGHNAFLRRSVNHTLFSAEPGNLYNKNSYKYSGGCGRRRVPSCAAP